MCESFDLKLQQRKPSAKKIKQEDEIDEDDIAEGNEKIVLGESIMTKTYKKKMPTYLKETKASKNRIINPIQTKKIKKERSPVNKTRQSKLFS